MNKKTLNDILSNYQDLEKDLIENDGELTDDIEDKLRINNFYSVCTLGKEFG